MVKGTSKRVIIVKSPDPKVFEEAIFIVREDYMRSPGITQAQLINDARKAADGYMGGIKRKKGSGAIAVAAASMVLGVCIAFAAFMLFFT